MPDELGRAMQIEKLARRYGVTPGAILREPAWLIRHVSVIEQAGM